MTRTAKKGGGGARGDGSEGVDDIEDEFLGLWLDIARLREKVLALARGAVAPPTPQPPRA